MWLLLVLIVLILLLIVLAVRPGRSTDAQRAPFEHRTFAHRGLYEKDQTVPENSLAAFRAAAEAGYGVELDVQLTRDKQIVVFHDDTLLRACGVDARVDAYSFEELQQMRLFGTEHTIPLFSEVLDTIAGRIPMIVELKTGGDVGTLCRLTREMLLTYGGAYCVESFDPHIVRWFYRNAPEVLRGQLSEQMRYSIKGLPWHLSFVASRLLMNCLTHPQFIAYRVGKKPLLVRLSEAMGAMRVAWTARPEDDHDKLTQQYDAIIFEHYRPPLTY